MICKNVTLFENEGKSYLQFCINNDCKPSIDLNSDDQSKLKDVFYKIIELCLEEDFEFNLEIADGYDKNLYIEISEEYIKQLNAEIVKIRERIPDGIKTKEKL